MKRLSVITLTMNEAANIGGCLESVRWAEEIIVVDSGSTDGTQEAARRYTQKIFTIPWPGYGAARNYALAQATGEWILWLDADERVTPELGEEIRALLATVDMSVAGYSVARRAYFLGRWIRHCGWYPSRVVRLFQRSRGHFTETRVHERLKLDGAVKEMRNDLLHFTDPSLYHYLTKFNKYTSLGAEDLHGAGRRFRLSDLVVRPVFQFVKMYVLRRGFLDGMQGFLLSVFSSAYTFTKYAKLWEIERGPEQQGVRDGGKGKA
jgi:glycosyltransferase involved in cell wall biosynthesis